MTATLNFSFANNVGRRLRINMTLEGAAWDMAASGYDRARMEMRAPAESDNAALVLTTENGLLEIDGTALVIDIPRGAALGIPAGQYQFDVILHHPNERAMRPIKGTVTVERGVTRW